MAFYGNQPGLTTFDLGQVYATGENILAAREARNPNSLQNQLARLKIQKAQQDLTNPASEFGQINYRDFTPESITAFDAAGGGPENAFLLERYVAPKSIIKLDAGDEWQIRDALTNELLERIPKQLAPGELPSTRREQANQSRIGQLQGDMGIDYAAPVQSGELDLGVSGPPVTAAQVEAAKVEAQEAAKRQADKEKNKGKAQDAAKSAQQKTDMLKREIADARKLTGAFTTGFWGAVGQYVPGTDAYDLARKLETIKSNLGFDKLAELKRQSPTGGALGSVTEREGRKLEAVWGSLEQAQSKSQFLTALKRVEDQIDASYKAIADAYMRDYNVPWDGESTGLVIEINPQDNTVNWEDLQ